ncbi:MAG: ATP synthase F0 subunit B [SAR324 cluster bacterium]|nr:ATP synthase F0 subunit B [SAR324 cluster bacterium]
MDYKQAIIENAWGGVAVDYGLLHFQLATPIVTLVIIFIVYKSLNSFLFQPVLRTIDQREKFIQDRRDRVAVLAKEIETLGDQLDQKLYVARAEVAHVMNEAYEQSHKHREETILKQRDLLEKEAHNAHERLISETDQARATLQQLTEELSERTVDRLLN